MKELIEKLLKLQTLQLEGTAGPETADKIAKLRALIPAQILAHYDRLMARGKKGVAAVRDNVCTGCHMHVPLAVTMTLMHGDDIQICESCGRYLYLVGPLPTPAAAMTATTTTVTISGAAPAKAAKKSTKSSRRKSELLTA